MGASRRLVFCRGVSDSSNYFDFDIPNFDDVDMPQLEIGLCALGIVTGLIPTQDLISQEMILQPTLSKTRDPLNVPPEIRFILSYCKLGP
jgi:hypothetical protein